MKKTIRILFIVIVLVFMHTSICFASFPTFGITQPSVDSSLVNKLGGIIGVIQMVGGAVAVGASIYLGIRYVLSTTEDKAEIKKKMIPFIIGVAIFFGATGILKLIGYAAKWFG